MTDLKAGKQALRYFYDESTQFSAFPFSNFDAFLNYIDSNSNGQFMDGFGFAINSGGTDFWGNQAPIADSKVKAAMVSLADKAQGKVPEHLNSFFGYLSNEAVQVNFIDAVAATSLGTAIEVAHGAQAVGTAVLNTAQSTLGLIQLLPYVLFAGIVGYIYLKAKRA